MVRFDPADLQQRLAAALDTLGNTVYYNWLPVNDEAFDPAEREDLVVTADTEIDSCGLSSDESGDAQVTVGDLLAWADALKRFKLRDRTYLRMEGRTLIHVEPLESDELGFAEAISEGKAAADTRMRIDGRDFAVGLVTGFTPFAVFIEAEGENDEHLASFYNSTTYVQVEHPQDASDETVKDVARSFLFELASTASLVFSVAPYPRIDYWEGRNRRVRPKLKLRPLVLGAGLSDLYQLYLSGCAASPAEYALIHFVKVIEYVSATVVRLARHDALRRRLSSKAALSPDAAFLDDLTTLIEEQRGFTKDAEALKLTLHTCCDPVTLAPCAPRVLQQLRKVRADDDVKQQKAGIDELSACLSATRNQLSHAKANYELSGAECPSDQLAELASCAKTAAEQVIRWFSRLPPTSRVV